MIRVLLILAAVFAFAVTVAPASAAYLKIEMENVQISNYQLGVLDNNAQTDDLVP